MTQSKSIISTKSDLNKTSLPFLCFFYIILVKNQHSVYQFFLLTLSHVSSDNEGHFCLGLICQPTAAPEPQLSIHRSV